LHEKKPPLFTIAKAYTLSADAIAKAYTFSALWAREGAFSIAKAYTLSAQAPL
jgi:hypothetical protein